MEVLNISQFGSICRVCLKKGTLHPIFNYKDKLRPQEVHDLSIKMRLCAHVELAAGDGLPSKICKSCINLLIMAYHFKVASEKSDRTLRDILSKADDTPRKSKLMKVESSFLTSDDIKKNLSTQKRTRTLRSNVKKSKYTVNHEIKESGDEKKSLDPSSVNQSVSEMEVCETNTPEINRCSMSICNEVMSPQSVDDKCDLFHDMCNSDNEENKATDESKNVCVKSDDDFDAKANFTQDFYGCLECKRHFPTKVILHKHMAEEHGHFKKEYKCYACELMFPTKYKRSEHEKTSCPYMPPGTKYRCRDCEASCESRKDFDIHIRRHRTALAAPKANTLELGPIYPCPHCPKTLATHGSFYTHVQNHNKQDLVCEICGKCFKTRIRLMCHIKLHMNYKAFSCKECDFKTSTRNSLFLHMRKHSGERPYSCEVCGKLTATKSNLNSHRKRHTGVKDYKCDICGKSYVDKPPLEEHIMAVHAGLRPHGCQHCGATYTRKTGLRRHIKKRHPKGS